MSTRTYRYRGYEIQPKRDFGRNPSNQRGWVVVKGFCNIMPGGCWFESVREAREAIDVLIRVRGSARRFWEIMQPFRYQRVGQKADIEQGTVQQGRFKAIIENGRVTRLFRHARSTFA